MRTAPLLAATVGATAIAALALRGPATFDHGGPVALAAPAPSATLDWTAVVEALDAARAQAYADPPSADPHAWADPSCACLAEDRRRLADLAAVGRALDVGASSVAGVEADAVGADRVTVTFTDVLPPYAEVDATGRVVRAWPGRGPQRWRGLLVRVDGGWRWRELARVPDDHGPARRVDPRSAG